MNLPSFLCIGAQKAATSWLYKSLSEHPDIWMPPIKELHYFDHLYVPGNRNWTQLHLRKGARAAIARHVSNSDSIDLTYVKYVSNLALANVFTESWYQNAFNRPEGENKILGDITPEYCTIPIEGIEYVKSLLGSIKLIYIIRDPLDRALSQIRMALERQYGHKAPELTVEQLQEVVSNIPIHNRGNYKNYFPNWINVFGSKSFLFIPFKLIEKDPNQVMRMIETHLELSNYSGYSSLTTPTNASVKIDIPDSVVRPHTNKLALQRDFLDDFFDPEFCSMI